MAEEIEPLKLETVDIDDFAKGLHGKMEQLDPTDKPEWDMLDGPEKQFYRHLADFAIEDIMARIRKRVAAELDRRRQESLKEARRRL